MPADQPGDDLDKKPEASAGDASGSDAPANGASANGAAASDAETDGASEDQEAFMSAVQETGDDQVAQLEAEVAKLKDQLMRAAADLQNARKRADKERREAEAYGGAKLARDILTVYDNLDAAIKLASDELQEREPGFFNGVSLTQKELINAFGKHSIKPIDPEIGEKFDPNQHQAMFEAPAPGAEAGTVMQVIQVGFMISGRLLRPAMVGVASGDAGAASAEAESASS